MQHRRCWYILAGLLIVSAPNCLAEINLVQDTSVTSESSTTANATFSHTPTEGNVLVAIAGGRVGSAAPTTPTGWSVAISQPTGSPGQIIYYKIAGASESATLSVGPYANSTSRGLHLYEYSGVDTSDILEDTASSSGTGTTLSSGSVTTTDEAVTLAGVMTNANTTISGWTNSFTEWNDFINAGSPSNKSRYGGADIISLDAGTFSTSVTASGSGAWIGQAVALNAAQNCACTVTTVADNGTGSLREALTKANNCTGTTISFNIPAPGNMSKGTDSWWRIQPDSVLPIINSRSTTIDGTTQTTNQGDSNSVGPEIEINGDSAGTVNGFHILKPDNTMKGMAINGFSAFVCSGFYLYGDSASRNTIQGCYLGTSATGDSAIGNYYGMRIMSGPSDNDIGGSGAGQGNVISGNLDYGIQNGAGCNNNTFKGNFIGTNAACDAALANGDDGMSSSTCRGITIGGPNAGEGNVFSGNTEYGLWITSTDSLTLQGNKIGVDSSGTTMIPNTLGGIYLSTSDTMTIGGTAAGAENIISGNNGPGLYMWAPESGTIYGNMIGTGPNGTETGLGNGGDYSIWLGSAVTTKDTKIGGLGAGEGNVIAEGAKDGIVITVPGPSVVVAGNTIRDHDSSGVVVEADSLKILGNLIYGNGLDGINFVGDDTTLFIYHNTIHGNGSDGIEIGSDSAIIKNNIITGNAGYGIRADSGVIVESYNVITDASTNPANASGRSSGSLDASDLNSDPQYNDTTSSDFSLTECTSPAVNAGVDLGGDQPDMNGSDPGNYTGAKPDMGAFESTCLLTLSIAVNNSDFAFGTVPANQWLTPDSSLAINDGSAAEDFVGQISQFTDGSNTWDIDATTNGADSIRVQWSTTSDTGPWTDISAYATDFEFATNVATSDTVTVWFRIQTPVSTSSNSEYSSSFTVTAESP